VSAPQPLYVLEKHLDTNALIVGPRQALGRNRFQVGRVNWVQGQAPDSPIRVHAQVRYHAKEAAAQVHPLSRSVVEVQTQEPLPNVTPGQAAVFYSGDICLGGGTIEP
jgi:tRNA-specific 2-thiouridylase